MDFQLSGKTALVTGASIGIGHAIARGLAAEGVKLCITARRRDLLENLARQITDAGGQQPAIVIQDMIEDDASEKLAKQALTLLGGVDIIINCAGGGGPPIAIDGPQDD